MVIAILLLVVAIMLFGSSAVIGVFGWVAGFIAFSAALAFAGSAASSFFHLTLEQSILIGFLIVLAVIALGKLYMDYRERRR